MNSSVVVFKTNLQTKQDVCSLAHRLTAIQGLARWNVDLDDCDRVLRLEGTGIDSKKIQALVQQAGFFCEELED